MARIKGRQHLTAWERELKRKARVAHSFSDAAYRHYDLTLEGYGSTAAWEAAAEALAAGRGVFKGAERQRSDNPDLELLGLIHMPTHIAGLKSAFRKAAMTAHPDQGGTAEAFRAVYAAYERLVRFY
jgi:hypothetical protein